MIDHAGALRLATIDSDSSFAQVFSKRVAGMGWELSALDAAVEPDELAALSIDCLVVDLAGLGPPGWDYLERVARTNPGLGVVICTESSTVAERVRGLRLGADDWISKPCHPEEVAARVEAVVRRRRRAGDGDPAEPLVAGEVEIRPDLFQAFVGADSLDLTRREFELLQLLARARGTVLQRDEIYHSVWGYGMAHGDRSVDVFVRKLRQKLETLSPRWRYIHTHFGIGYRFDPETDELPDTAPGAPSPAAPPPDLSFTAG